MCVGDWVNAEALFGCQSQVVAVRANRVVATPEPRRSSWGIGTEYVCVGAGLMWVSLPKSMT